MREFGPSYILKILHVIRYKLSASELTELGLDYSQIADLMSEVIQKGYVENLQEGDLKITDSGLALLEKLNNETYPENANKWMLPLEEFRSTKIGKFDIYLPKQKKKAG